MKDREIAERFVQNIEVERNRLGLSQKDMAEAIGMSLSSYKRMLNGEMSMKASLVVRNLYYLTGKCFYELMEIYDDKLRVATKVRNLDEDHLKAIEAIIDLMNK